MQQRMRNVGGEVLSLSIDKDGMIYDARGYCIEGKALSDFLKKVTEK